MRLQRLLVKNWRNFTERELLFGDMTSIRGPNGSGKTSLVDAALFALTGEIRTPGTNNMNIAQKAGLSAVAEVSLTFEHLDTTATITRCISHDEHARIKPKLIIAGETVTDFKKIRERLRDFLGVDENILFNYVFVEQWGMFSFISQKDAERTRALNQLFGVDRAERIWAALGEVKLAPALVSLDGEAIRKRLEASLLQREELQQTCDELELWLEMNRENFARASAARDDRSRCAMLRQQFAQLEKRLVNLRDETVTIRTRLDRVLADVSRGESFLTTNQERLRACREALQTNDAFRRYWNMVEPVRATLARVDECLEKLLTQPVTPPAGLLDVVAMAEAEQRLREEEYQLRCAQDFHEVFHQGVSQCPVCATEVTTPSVAERIAKTNQELPLLTTRVETLRQQLATGRQFYREQRQREQQIAQLRDMKAQQEKFRDSIPVVQPPTMSVKEAVDFVNKADLVQKRLDELGQERARLTQQLAANHSVATTVEETLSDVVTLLNKFELADYCEESANSLLAEYASVTNRRQDLQRELTFIENSIQADRELLVRVVEETNEFWAVRRTIDHLSATRELFHKNQLPRMITTHRLAVMKATINENLADFGTNFLVRDTQDLRFNVEFTDGCIQPAERLSGGQKVLLALAFRMAINSLFAGQLGVLCLDEPTAGLDHANLSCLSVAINKLREISSSRGLQVILITHEKELDNVCDAVIDLSL